MWGIFETVMVSDHPIKIQLLIKIRIILVENEKKAYNNIF